MKPLPATRYEFAEWKTAIVNIDYHVDVDGHYYSVPHGLVSRRWRCASPPPRSSASSRASASPRTCAPGCAAGTPPLPEHMPEAHRKHLQWTPGRLLNWALSIGPATRDVVQWQLENRPHPEQGYRACLGLLNLAKHYGEARLEAACRRALAIGSPTRKSIKSILEAKLDQHPESVPGHAEPASFTPAAPARQCARAGLLPFHPTSQGDTEPCSSNPPSIH